jgi:periplasmic copper chaperone A
MRLIVLATAALLWGCGPETPPQSPPPAQVPPPVSVPGEAGAVVSGAWVRAVPPTARMTAGYLSVHNPGPEPLVIIGAESPLFASVEVHGTEITDGVARMRQQSAVTVAPGEAVSFEPGGLHLMLMQPVDGIPSSGTVEISLLLQDGARLEFLASVGPPSH